LERFNFSISLSSLLTTSALRENGDQNRNGQMTNITTDIIIVFYGERNEVNVCVDSVERQCKGYKLHIIDNNVTNRGFTKGVNEGIDKGAGDA
jgi:hypothetical protein